MSGNLNEVKTKVDDTVEKMKDSKAGKAVLGEDGKFDKGDVDRLTQEAKDSKLGKTVLGDDGKFNKDDVGRITGEAKAAVKGAVEKIKDMID